MLQSFLYDNVQISLHGKRNAHLWLTGSFLCSLNHLAVLNLSESAGKVRNSEVYIEGAKFTPPDRYAVDKAFGDYIVGCHRDWETRGVLELAAFALWGLTHVHPFEDGNGRTARVAAYFVMCRKYGMWLPGRTTILQQIRQEPREYYAGLQHATEAVVSRGAPDLVPLQTMLGRYLEIQLDSSRV
ncbi:MAG: Fic family protein [Alphaproteobacteria bacterium]